MALGLHPNCIAQLRASLAEQLGHAVVRHGIFLAPSSSLYLFLTQATLPERGKVHALLQKFIGEAPLVDFVNGLLSQELHENQPYRSEEGPIPLSSIAQYANLTEVATRLTEAFESLPWQYTVTAPLPSSFSEIFRAHIKSFDLSDTISVRSGDEFLTENYPLVSGIKKRDDTIAGGGLLIASKPSWKPDRAYLQVRVQGFIGKYTETEPLLEAINVVRAFCGLAIALRLLKPGFSYQPHLQREQLFIHQDLAGKWVVLDSHELETRHSVVIRDLVLHDLDGYIKDDTQRAHWMRTQLATIGAIFQAGERARNILLGAQWLLESYCGSDELLQYVQAAVVVEILLGDKVSSDQTGLGELLANRCAYSIASTHTQRIEILQDFRKIYDVRSKIVHRGKSRLALAERNLFGKLRWICRRIIQEEAELLEKDLAKKDT